MTTPHVAELCRIVRFIVTDVVSNAVGYGVQLVALVVGGGSAAARRANVFSAARSSSLAPVGSWAERGVIAGPPAALVPKLRQVLA